MPHPVVRCPGTPARCLRIQNKSRLLNNLRLPWRPRLVLSSRVVAPGIVFTGAVSPGVVSPGMVFARAVFHRVVLTRVVLSGVVFTRAVVCVMAPAKVVAIRIAVTIAVVRRMGVGFVGASR